MLGFKRIVAAHSGSSALTGGQGCRGITSKRSSVFRNSGQLSQFRGT